MKASQLETMNAMLEDEVDIVLFFGFIGIKFDFLILVFVLVITTSLFFVIFVFERLMLFEIVLLDDEFNE